jgi:sugar lactone lactonase YvrE
VAALPSNDATENLCQQADGSFYVTQIEAKKVIKVGADNKVSEFASAPMMAEILGAGCGDNENAFVVYGKSFRGPATPPPAPGAPAAAPNFSFADTDTHVYVYDLTGKMTADIAAQKGQGFNGLTYSGTSGLYYAANSNAGEIYAVDTKAKKITLWWKDDSFAPVTGAPIAINGIKVSGGWVYFSDGTLGQAPKRGVYKLQIGPDGKPMGSPVKIEDTVAVDDFAVGADGAVYFPAGTSLYKVAAAGGTVTKIADPIAGGPSAVVSRDGKYVYWSTRGGNANQRLVRVAIP